MSKAQLDFIDQRTRQLLVKWCDHALRNGGTIPDLLSLSSKSGEAVLAECASLEMHPAYFNHALTKKWLSAKVVDGRRQILGGGWNTAKSFLKR